MEKIKRLRNRSEQTSIVGRDLRISAEVDHLHSINWCFLFDCLVVSVGSVLVLVVVVVIIIVFVAATAAAAAAAVVA